MNWDNTLRRIFERIILNMQADYDTTTHGKWLEFGLLDILELVEAESALQGRDDHEELAFCIFRFWYNQRPPNNTSHRNTITGREIDYLDQYLWHPVDAIVDLYMAAYHIDDEIRSTAVEGRRAILTLADKERLQEIAVKIITHPEGIFQGPGHDCFSFISVLESFYHTTENAFSFLAKDELRSMRIFVEVDKKCNQASNRYWGKYGELEKYVDHEDREIRERVRELLGILQTPPFVNSRAKPVEEGITMRYYTDGDRTDVDENGELIDWAATDIGLYYIPEEAPEDEEDTGGSDFENLGDLFG